MVLRDGLQCVLNSVARERAGVGEVRQGTVSHHRTALRGEDLGHHQLFRGPGGEKCLQ